MNESRRVSIFRNGRSQAVRIPKDFEFEGTEVIIRKEPDGSLTLVPERPKLSPKEIVAWLRLQPPLSTDDFPAFDDSDMKSLDGIEL